MKFVSVRVAPWNDLQMRMDSGVMIECLVVNACRIIGKSRSSGTVGGARQEEIRKAEASVPDESAASFSYEEVLREKQRLA